HEPSDTEGCGVPEAHLPHETAEPVPGERSGHHQVHQRAQIERIGVEQERQEPEGEQSRPERESSRDASPPHPSTGRPNKPPGRSTSTNTSITKPTAEV